MGETARNYRDLIAWQEGNDLVDAIYDLSAGLPATERFGLSDQIRRAVISIPANIAEGSARDSTKDFFRFVSISRASLAEVMTFIEIIRRRRYTTEDTVAEVEGACRELERILAGLRRSLRRRLQ